MCSESNVARLDVHTCTLRARRRRSSDSLPHCRWTLRSSCRFRHTPSAKSSRMRENDGRKLDHATLAQMRFRAVDAVRDGMHREDVAAAPGIRPSLMRISDALARVRGDDGGVRAATGDVNRARLCELGSVTAQKYGAMRLWHSPARPGRRHHCSRNPLPLSKCFRGNIWSNAHLTNRLVFPSQQEHRHRSAVARRFALPTPAPPPQVSTQPAFRPGRRRRLARRSTQQVTAVATGVNRHRSRWRVRLG